MMMKVAILPFTSQNLLGSTRMTRFITLFAVLAALTIGFLPSTASANHHGHNNSKGNDIVDVAVAAGSFSTLAAALTAADLVDDLKAKGPFTVFAPTDEAFAKLPAGTVESLLEPENKDQLIAILTYHVAVGNFDSGDVSNLRTVETLNGARVSVSPRNGSLFLNESKVVTADIAASNGIIHVIDSVLLPPADNKMKGDEKESAALIQKAISLGAPLYNEGNPRACAAVYEVAIDALLKLDDELPGNARGALSKALRNGMNTHNASDRAWAYRRGLDSAMNSIRGGMMTSSNMSNDALKGEYSERVIRSSANGLVYYHKQFNTTHNLVPLSNNTYLVEGVPGFRIQFVGNDSGKAEKIIGLYSDGGRDESPRTM